MAIAIAVGALAAWPTPLGGAATAATAYFRHVTPIDADFFASFPTGCSSLVGGEFVGLAFLVGCPSAFACYLALAVGVHGGEASVLGAWCGFHVGTDSLHPSR
jgi:hypothetical protein